ncbi:MAG TPA: LPXTG cell wall anchor domain-containing protein [Flavihumibacter sp.]|nr:LPXTG cell wall anchor domain-containing protein [Flavihumibacter sp.]HPZ87054.1 LPXTG cell wall anchor domain-containing protein [Flavihumibacter sp.]HQD08970.1 LPXTG cell wall anchor domain-containing protein [Flavihumibacter sp.]
MRYFRLCITVISFLTLVCTGVSAQHIQLKASVDKNNILIGEPILLTLEGEFPADQAHNWFSTDSINHFDIIERTAIDTAHQGTEQFLKQVLRITSFDSGTWTIPMMSLKVGDNHYLTDSIQIEVGYTPADPNKPYHGIRDIIEVPVTENNYLLYIVGIAGLLALLLALYFLFRKKKTTVAKEVKQPPISAIEQARTALKALKTENLSTSTGVKQYYSRLNEILREYLLAKKILPTPDSSNRELLFAIYTKLDNTEKQNLAKALTLADAAKFAKYQPNAADHEETFQTIQSSIEKIELDNKVLS